MPPDRGAGGVDGADDHPDVDLPDAVRHLLPRETQPDEAFDASFLAVAGSGRGLCRDFPAPAAPERYPGAGGDGLRAGSRSDGRGGYRRHAGGQCRYDGDVQPSLQHGRRPAGARDPDLYGNGCMYLCANSGPYRAAAGDAVRCGAVLSYGYSEGCGDHTQISFYMWLASLLVIIGRTTAFIIDLHDASLSTELWLAFAALVICLAQFKVGRMLGRRYGDAPAGGQSLGQKNTVLAVWMAQSFLDPIASIAPTAYIVWQNFVNSYQLWKKDREG